MVTGTSVLGITFDGGVMIAADTLGIVGMFLYYALYNVRMFNSHIQSLKNVIYVWQLDTSNIVLYGV